MRCQQASGERESELASVWNGETTQHMRRKTMVTMPIASAFWTKFAAAPCGWLDSQSGKWMVARAVAMVRTREGDAEADALENLCTVAAVADVLLR